MQTVAVNPQILVWARETAGLTPDEAVKKLGIKDARGMAAVSRLEALEMGEAEPSRPTLVKMARHYRRPLLTFYLSNPPRQTDRGADFRSLPNEARDAKTEALVDALVRDIRVRQSMVRAALEDEEETEPLQWVGSCNMSDGRDKALDALRALLDVGLEEFRRQRDPASSFGLLRERAGKSGVFVLLKGNLGSYHTALDLSAFRGLCIADPIAPFIVVNDRDSQPAWSFTLLHELAHLLLGQTGVSGAYGAAGESSIERFCNDVAGEFLLPSSEITGSAGLGLRNDSPLPEAARAISDFARPRKVSRTMVAYRARQAGAIDQTRYAQLAAGFLAQWRQDSEQRNDDSEGGPSYYPVKRHRLGRELIQFVQRMAGAGALTTAKAARILDVKPAQVQALLYG